MSEDNEWVEVTPPPPPLTIAPPAPRMLVPALPPAHRPSVIIATPSSSVSPAAVIGISGNVLIMAGVFLPLFTVPIMGSINWFMGGKGDGAYVLGIAALGLVFAFTARRLQILTAIATAVMLGRLFMAIGEGQRSLAAMDDGEGFFELFSLVAMQPQIGAGAVVIGAILSLVSAIMPTRAPVTMRGY